MYHKNSIKLIRLPDVLSLTGICRSSLYSKIKKGLFVPPVQIGARSVAWIESEVNALLQGIVSGYDAEQIRALVADLVAARECAA